MVAHIIGFLLQNLPALLFVIALVIARFFMFSFPLLLRSLLGGDMSPFQLEVGMADLAIGATACIAFWRDLSFKAAAVSVASIFLLGDAVGHVKQMLIAGNFAPGNAGVPFYMDIICPVLAIAFLVIAKRQSAVRKS